MAKTAAKKQGDNPLIVGIDLGTSRSAISAKNGKREIVESYVGWPKDFVSKKVVGKDVLFGREAVEHRLSLNLSRPLENGVIKDGSAVDREAVTELIGHLIDLVKTEKDHKRSVRAVIGVPSEAFKANKVTLQQCLAEFTDAQLIVSEPFAVAYGLELLDNAIVIDIGAGTVDFCIMHGSVPTEEDQRTIYTAGDYIDQQLFKQLRESYPESDFNINMMRSFKEQHSFVGDDHHSVEVDIPVNGVLTAHDITAEIKEACESILAPIVETTLELIANFDPEYQERIRSNIILSGGGSQIVGIAESLEASFNEYGVSKVTVVEDALFAGSDGALALSKDMPEEYWNEETTE